MRKSEKTKRLTNRSIEAFRCPSGKDRAFLWDDAITGFGLVAFPSPTPERVGKKAFILQFRLHGRSRRMTIGAYGVKTLTQARSEATKLLGVVEDGRDPLLARAAERAVRDFGAIADEFMHLHVRQKRKAQTAAEYQRLLDRYLLPALGTKRIVDVQTIDVARMHGRLKNAPFTANRCLAIVSSIWNWAARRKEVSFADNPAKGVERYQEHRRERFLTADEFARLGEALREAETAGIPWRITAHDAKARRHLPKNPDPRRAVDPYAIAAIRLLILTGARLREILDTKWEWIDFGRAIILLPDSKTGRKTIYLSAPALALLSHLPRKGNNPFIVAGESMDAPRVDLRRPWAAICQAAKLDGIRIHDLRHSFASVGAGASLGLPIIGKLLGHTQPATTARYSHLDADPMHCAANLIGDRIAAALDRKEGGDIFDLSSRRA